MVYFIVLSVLSVEGLLDQEMMAFTLMGSKEVDMTIRKPQTLTWMTASMFADLEALSKITPFSTQNLTTHITANSDLWDQLYHSRRFTFKDVPSAALFDFQQIINPPDTLLTKVTTGLKGKLVETFMNPGKKSPSKAQSAMTIIDGLAGLTSRSKGQNKEKVWTEEEILADEDLWRVESDLEEEQLYTRTGKAVKYNPYVRNKEYYDDDEEFKEEQMFMARFLTEQAPNYSGNKNTTTYQEMIRMTRKEKS